jgi:hypothetical protein
MLVVMLIAILHEAVLGLRFFLEREQTLLNTAADNHKPSLASAIAEERRATTSTSSRPYVNANENESVQKGGEVRRELREIFRFLKELIKNDGPGFLLA